MVKFTQQSVGWKRTLALVAINVLGVVAIIASGGGEPTGGGPAPSPPPAINKAPENASVEAGDSAVFSVTATTTNEPLRYQWQRATATSRFVDIPGATGATYTLDGAQPGDDGALFRVAVSDTKAGGFTEPARLAVSPLPGLIFEDGDFQPDDWETTVFIQPSSGAGFEVDQLATGGNPDAFRKMTHTLPLGVAGAGGPVVYHVRKTATYDPVAQGAINVIDYQEDSSILVSPLRSNPIVSHLLLEQDGRRYLASFPSQPLTPPTPWTTLGRNGLQATDFVIADGPPCDENATCPDFSASGKPIRFGYRRDASTGLVVTAATIESGIDNWKVTVWRR